MGPLLPASESRVLRAYFRDRLPSSCIVVDRHIFSGVPAKTEQLFECGRQCALKLGSKYTDENQRAKNGKDWKRTCGSDATSCE